MSEAAMPERRAELEHFFAQFPDLPKEAVIKEDVIRLGLRFSDAALEAGTGCRVKSYRLFTYDRDAHDSLGRQEPLKIPEDFKVRDGEYALRPTVMGVRLSAESPYLVDVVDGQLTLLVNGKPLATIDYPPAPKYYSMKFEDGVSYSEIAPLVFDGHIAFITLFRYCQFWGEKEECKFCDINENTRQLKKSGRLTVTQPFKKLEHVVGVMETIFKGEQEPWQRMLSYVITGGAITKQLGGKQEKEFYLQYVEAIKDRIGSRWPCQLQTVAKDKATLKRFRASGVDVHNSNIEVWDERLFKLMCPGKDKYVGRGEWIKRVVESVEVFGEGNVTPNLVAGVEMAQPYGFKDVDSAVKSTSEGLDYLMSHGVTPRFNNWCVEPASALAGNQPPPLEYYVRMIKAYHETWKKYKLPPLSGMGPMGPGRAINQNSAFLDVGS